ncbi:outer membrane beta-barrel protein [Sphingobacterium thalpophilum]|uniref:outer membrane beta-barrel protein n=1 Tax=Sphingobacterium thalpophilum TaxID=259 RepID=UPI002D77395F|nr:outer membrane beta-barrel protein [Sphingobacterium thalpophilum]
MKRFILIFALLSSVGVSVHAQGGADTIHYRKVYYWGTTGMGFPLGETKNILSPKFSGSIGLDISLKNPMFFVSPTLYTLSFAYKQPLADPDFAYRIEDANTNFYTVAFSGGVRKQLRRLNIYAFAGPGVGLTSEPRAQVIEPQRLVKMENKNHFNLSSKIGAGADYKFNGFFLGIELGYLHNFRKIQDTPVNIFTVMVGLKSDITQIGDKVIDVIGIDGSLSGKKSKK